QSCEGNCGEKFESCSCHSTCTSLKNCCRDYREYCVEIFPYSGSIMGGIDFVILDASFNKSSTVVCRFNNNTDTEGYVDENSRGHCISPLLYETGWVSVQISSDNGTTFGRVGAWLSHTGKLHSKFKATMVNSTKWQYYGTPNVGGTLEMTWNTSLVRGEKVNIELWGYSETWQAEWTYLYSLAKDQPNSGSFSFLPKPAENDFSSWELGAVRVSPSTYQDGTNVQAMWTEDHALAWHLEDKFRQDSALWALDKCVAWNQLENKLPNFTSEIIDCPCTLAQARADTGRFHTDYGCDIEKGSVCTYHPGTVHCVRAIQAPKYAAGQQCCYDSTGAQVLTADSIGGSTPDRAHDWGSPPYNKPPRIPGQSHWVYDVLSFYYCCLWSDNCHYYFKHRPSSDCRRYESPSSVVFGDPHFITFDGVSYSFNGKGEYTLVTSETKQLTIQGRTEPVNIIYFFCLTGAVSNASTLFTYDSEYLLDTYYYGSKHDASFVPVFSVPDSPDDPLANEASEICSGEGSQFCRYCGWLSPPINGRKEGTTYLQGAKVRLSCDDGFTLRGPEVRVCQATGQWSGEDTKCV
uniref:Uncharacterized protein n=1 Tax=Mola mola TaxID=94237 RepID=A0A3Q3WSJ3_MOLML